MDPVPGFRVRRVLDDIVDDIFENPFQLFEFPITEFKGGGRIGELGQACEATIGQICPVLIVFKQAQSGLAGTQWAN